MSQNWFLNTPLDTKEKWTLDKTNSIGVNVHLIFADYYKRLSELIKLTNEGDEIFIVGWLAELTVELIPGQTALAVLSGANQRNVSIRLLLTGNVSHLSVNKVAVDNINNLKGRGQKKAVIDNQLADYSDHHQKAVFIRIKGNPFLFIGGMDIAENHLGWIDAQAEIMGAGALLGLNTFEERWNSVNLIRMLRIMPFIEYRFPNLGTGFTEQFIRTYPPTKNNNKIISNRNYAPDGDFTYDSLLRNAIKNAQTSIYQEDQFFDAMGNIIELDIPMKGSDKIKRSDLRGKSLDRLIYDKANKEGFQYFGIGFNFFSSAFPSQFKKNKFNSNQSNTFPALMTTDKVFNCHFNGIDRIFHSKLWIFDDEFLVIGSANYWNPSFNLKLSQGHYTKSEFGVAITSTKATGESLGFPNLPYIHALRLKMWERIRKIQDPNFSFLPNQVGNFENEFNIFIADIPATPSIPAKKLFIPMT